MSFWLDIAAFAAKALILFAALAGLVLLFMGLLLRRRFEREHGQIQLLNLNDHLLDMGETIRSQTLPAKAYKAHRKALKKKLESEDAESKRRVFVIDFDGDLIASGVTELREIINALVQIAEPRDEVVVRLESPGGIVHNYGLAAAQLARLRDRDIRLTICVDKVAASGGYMMAAVGHRILSAPFAVLGSIGVIAMFPNFNRLLKKHEIDYLELTAGEFKRTLTTFGEVTEKGVGKMREELEETHDLFKHHVQHYRPSLNLDKVATGEHWYGIQALELGLVDALKTSDDYLLEHVDEAILIQIEYEAFKSVKERMAHLFTYGFDRALTRVIEIVSARLRTPIQ